MNGSRPKACTYHSYFIQELITFPPITKYFMRCDTNNPTYYSNNKHNVPPAIQDYNDRFTKLLGHIKSRHDPTVTTVAQGVLEWKRNQNAKHIGLDIQAWLDRFYLSRIGIRFLMGQRAFLSSVLEINFHSASFRYCSEYPTST